MTASETAAAPRTTAFQSVRSSLRELLGDAYVAGVCQARAALTGGRVEDLRAIADRQVAFFPEDLQRRLVELLPRTGEKLCPGLDHSATGAAGDAFAAAARNDLAPLSGLGYFRLGEGGRLHLITKAEHYHAVLGHGFPGYGLLALARELGIPNATHNNTRGHITRLAEEALVRAANGIAPGDEESLRRVMAGDDPQALCRVLNLATGSLAAEAALKMLLARFWRIEDDSPPPKYAGRVPVVLVVGNDDEGLAANYHGTTLATQILRGMWPEPLAGLEAEPTMAVRAVRPNRIDDLEAAFAEYDVGRYKIAGFMHEIVMMNYGARRMDRNFLQRAYDLCRASDAPTVADEVQTGIWRPEVYMFREYGLRPDILVVGKGFPGGEYAASRVLCTPACDRLPQFGALVTNGQEELASLAYLVTMKWAAANASVTRLVGEYYEDRLGELAAAFPQLLAGTDGSAHAGAICFHERQTAKAFAARLDAAGLDISVQAYKADCPPAALTKLPLIAGYEAVDFIVTQMAAALGCVAATGKASGS